MAKEVLDRIKAAEEQANEKRRVALVSAKDSLKMAQQEDETIKDKELTAARHEALVYVEGEEKKAKAELDELQEKRKKECEDLKVKAQGRLQDAAKVCIERILS